MSKSVATCKASLTVYSQQTQLRTHVNYVPPKSERPQEVNELLKEKNQQF